MKEIKMKKKIENMERKRQGLRLTNPLLQPSAVTNSFKRKGNRKRENFFACQGMQRVSLSAIELQFCRVHGNLLPIIIYFFKEKGFLLLQIVTCSVLKS